MRVIRLAKNLENAKKKEIEATNASPSLEKPDSPLDLPDPHSSERLAGAPRKRSSVSQVNAVLLTPERRGAVTELLSRDQEHPFTLDEENTLRTHFLELQAGLSELETIRSKTPETDPEHRAAVIAAATHALDFYARIGDRPRLSRMLDVGTHLITSGRFTAFEKNVAAIVKRAQSLQSEPFETQDLKEALAAIDGDLATRTMQRLALRWFQSQIVARGAEHVGGWLSHQRFSARVANALLPRHLRMDRTQRAAFENEPIIKKEQRDELYTKLQPGDVVVTRNDWILANFARPGHFMHAFIHTGTREDMKRTFDADPDVRAYVRKKTNGATDCFTDYLATTYPKVWADYAKVDTRGAMRVIESTGSGVHVSGDDAFTYDHVGVMRTRLPKASLAVAIDRLFKQVGLPYDNNFDVATEDKLICTESVARALQPGGEMAEGLTFPSVWIPSLGGRYSLPPDFIVKEASFDFVAYLQSDAATQTARFASEREFRKSHTLPNEGWRVPAAIRALKDET
jgi:hypothetical protein